MRKTLLIYRKKRPEFNSIENVFNALSPFLDVEYIELPYFSTGLINRFKNISFIRKQKALLNHISGYDHYLALGLKRKKTILTIHDIEVLKRTIGLKRYILKKIWFDWPIKKVNTVTTISEFSKMELLRLNNYKTPIVVIPNPLTLPLAYIPKKFNSHCPTILHLGVKANKNLSRLIQAIKEIPCTLVIVGAPNPSIIQELTNNIINYTFKTNISNDEIIKEYQNCDILSFVSTYEGFGLPIIEAQALGRAVITSNCSSMPEVSGDGALLVNPNSIEEIRAGIKRLIVDTQLREDLIKKGLENIKRFKPEKIAKQYTNLYQEVIDA